jgi:hypothetical protein
MADLYEKQFELDGQVFGWDCPVDIKDDGFRPGGNALRTSDADLPTEDGRRFGVDLRGGETWGFSLFTSPSVEGEGWAAYRDVKQLRYRLGGQNRCVYGRPRRWTPGDTKSGHAGLLFVEADFETVDAQVYDAEVKAVRVGMGSPLAMESGFIVPFTPPFTSIPRSTDSTDEAFVDSDEDTQTWVTIMFTTNAGSLSEAEVTVGEWTARLRDTIPPYNAVTLDPRPWVRSAQLASGGGVAINPRVTRMANMWLPAGRHPIIFNGIDPTGSATCTVSWQNARRSPR